eukprot:CAMPEP_0113692672 /NCGR_PEP_ID=MMETSP0038_2-20120614/19222_1 /TAXON_ID=2898 /ORGANISM="Cryptomonas paramecium" /LENGTH=137 /DNA_ID=CAMNT_0000614625 /DNA_START=48 /DNA_END=457 /DNA_ORIENTATION=- /assembly_acc=CAM_ASM_000170
MPRKDKSKKKLPAGAQPDQAAAKADKDETTAVGEGEQRAEAKQECGNAAPVEVSEAVPESAAEKPGDGGEGTQAKSAVLPQTAMPDAPGESDVVNQGADPSRQTGPPVDPKPALPADAIAEAGVQDVTPPPDAAPSA